MTRVLMTADAVGGVWTYALDLADALAPYDVEVHLAVMGPAPTPAQRGAAARSGIASLHEGPFALEWMADPWDDVDRAGGWLLDLAADLRPDVAHLNGYAHATLPWPAPTVVVAHSCVLSWWQAVHGTPAPPEWDTYRRRVRAGLHAADAVVAPSAAMLAELVRLYAVTDGVVVPNGREPRPAPVVAKQPLVVGTGRVWDEAKNLAMLERIAPRLPWPVMIAGATNEPRDAAADPAERAVMLGQLDGAGVAALLARAGVYVAPARYEPFGLGALEAAQAGCALVLGDIASLREVWADAALYVDPDDDDALVAAVAALADDGERRGDLAARARSRAATYSPQRTAQGYLDVYRRLPVPVGGGR